MVDLGRSPELSHCWRSAQASVLRIWGKQSLFVNLFYHSPYYHEYHVCRRWTGGSFHWISAGYCRLTAGGNGGWASLRILSLEGLEWIWSFG